MLCHIVPHAWAHMSQEGATWSHVSPVGPIVTIMSHSKFAPGGMHTCPMSPHQQQRCRSATFFPRSNSLVLHLSYGAAHMTVQISPKGVAPLSHRPDGEMRTCHPSPIIFPGRMRQSRLASVSTVHINMPFWLKSIVHSASLELNWLLNQFWLATGSRSKLVRLRWSN